MSDLDGPIAQLVRAPACHAGGRRFEPVLGRHICLGSSVGRAADWKSACRWFDSAPRHHLAGEALAGVAQLAEQLICNQQVVGSSPITGSTTHHTISYGQIPERPNGSDCKSDVFDFGGSNPPLPTTKRTYQSGMSFLCYVRGVAASPVLSVVRARSVRREWQKTFKSLTARQRRHLYQDKHTPNCQVL